MNISLPAPLKAWVDRQVEGQGYSTASEYVRDLLRREQQQQTQAYVEQKLTEAIESGPATPMTQADWQRIRSEGIRRAQRSGTKRRTK